MRRAFPVAVLLTLLATAAAADNFSARALLAFEKYGSASREIAGFRQTYDLRLDKALTTTSLVRLFFRGDDFNGDETSPLLSRGVGSRQLQPGAEVTLNTSNVIAQLRSEVIDTRSQTGGNDYNRRQDRSSALLNWAPEALPSIRVLGQRNKTLDDAAQVSLTDDSFVGQIQYGWHGLQLTGQELYSHALEPTVGYERKNTTQIGDVIYTGVARGGKLAYTADVNGQWMNLNETALNNQPTSVPSPVTISAALYTIDDTPLDNRDHPAAPYPALIDGNQNASAGINIGPDGVSFQNIVLDIGHIDRVDEIRVIVRDPAGNPLRNGGGPVVWDVYTSSDGQLWTPLISDTTFSNPLSLYSVTFEQTTARWFKVVNFSVNIDATLVSEVQAYYHTVIAAGQRRTGRQNSYSASTTIAVQPIDRVAFTYSGLYSSIRQDLANQPQPTTTTDIEHLATIQYDFARMWSIRTELLKRDVQTFDSTNDGAQGVTGYLDFIPTKQLRLTLELSKQDQVIDGTPFVIETRAIHANAFVLRSLSVMFDAGKQRQTISRDGSNAFHDFMTLTSNAQLTRRMRLLLTASMNRATSDSTDPVVQLLGPQRDNRIDADFIWRSGHELTVDLRGGYFSGELISGFTHGFRVDWYPFADGTLSLGGSYDQDIDPVRDRISTRTIFNPRWLINRWATFDVNYTQVTTKARLSTAQQRSLFATLTLYR